jgi:hypothetical protein
MTNEQTKTFFLTASRVREQNRIEALMNARRARAKREARWRFSFKFRLLRYRYGMTINLVSNYCGAVAQALKPRPGEDWCRGNDLRDGKFWRFPWVLLDILCYEFRLRRWGSAFVIPGEWPPPRDRVAAQQWPPAEALNERPV